MESSYEIRFSELTHHVESHGYIIRPGNTQTYGGTSNVPPEQEAVIREARQLVSRNQPGDRERALAVLSGIFSQVQLDVSRAPALDPSEPGLVIPGPDADVLVKTDGTVWSRSPHGEWSQEPTSAEVGRQLYHTLQRQRAMVHWLKRRLPALEEVERDSFRDVDYGMYTPSELLEFIHDEARARLFATAPSIAAKYRRVTDVEGDQFNLILAETGLSVPIRSREDLEEHLPLVHSE